MTMLMHTHGLFERAPASMPARNAAEADATAMRLAAIKQFCVSALSVLAVCGVLTAIVALQAAFYYWRFH